MNENFFVPKYAFLTSGKGEGADQLGAFDAALREAGVSSQNLVAVSSVFPPYCQLISKEEGLKMLEMGQISFCVMARQDSNTESKEIAASVGMAIPSEKKYYGYLSECHGTGLNEKEAGDCVQESAVNMLSAKLGIDASKIDYAVKKNIAKSAIVRGNTWTSVVSLCVFVLE